MISHGGTWGTWLTKTVRVPEERLVVAILSVGCEQHRVTAAALQLVSSLLRDAG